MIDGQMDWRTDLQTYREAKMQLKIWMHATNKPRGQEKNINLHIRDLCKIRLEGSRVASQQYINDNWVRNQLFKESLTLLISILLCFLNVIEKNLWNKENPI